MHLCTHYRGPTSAAPTFGPLPLGAKHSQVKSTRPGVWLSAKQPWDLALQRGSTPRRPPVSAQADPTGPRVAGRGGRPLGRTGRRERAWGLACAALRHSWPWTARGLSGVPPDRVDGSVDGIQPPPTDPPTLSPPPAHRQEADPARRSRRLRRRHRQCVHVHRATSQSKPGMDARPQAAEGRAEPWTAEGRRRFAPRKAGAKALRSLRSLCRVRGKNAGTRIVRGWCPALVLYQPCTCSRGALHFLPKKCLPSGSWRAHNGCTFQSKSTRHGTHI